MKKIFSTVLVVVVVLSLALGFMMEDPFGSKTAPSTTKQAPSNPVNVSYGTPVYTDNFDGANDTAALRARGYLIYQNSSPRGTTFWFQGNDVVFNAYNGPTTGYVGANYNATTGVGQIDVWMVTPKLAGGILAGDSLFFYARSTDVATTNYPDSIRVMYSTSDSTVSGTWTELGRFRVPNPPAGSGTWTKFKFRAPTASANGRFAIRYNVAGGGPSGNNSDYIGIDALTIERTSAPAGYFTNFDSYTVGQRLACQDSLNWTTWSIAPCNTTEDPLISNAQSFSPTKSVVITQNNDLVKRLNKDSTGIHEISMKFYVPTGKAGYWNTLAVFSGSSSQWGMECYFDVTATGNNGRLFGGSATAVPFPYTHGAWQTAKLLVNLDVDSAKFYINGTLVNKWRWTAGANGSAVPKKLGGNDFFGATATDEMYIDDYSYVPGANWITDVTQNGNTVPVEYALSQNYPNPFNPTTKINFALPKSGLVTMKVYDILGKEVATLVNEVKNAGSYTVDFNASALTSGVYFYKVSVNGFSEVKKMLLLK